MNSLAVIQYAVRFFYTFTLKIYADELGPITIGQTLRTGKPRI